MNSQQFNELAGRIQGLSDFVMHLTAELEIKEIIDGPRLNQAVREFAANRNFEGEHLQATRRTLNEMAHFLNDARVCRQAQQRQLESRKC